MQQKTKKTRIGDMRSMFLPLAKESIASALPDVQDDDDRSVRMLEKMIEKRKKRNALQIAESSSIAPEAKQPKVEPKVEFNSFVINDFMWRLELPTKPFSCHNRGSNGSSYSCPFGLFAFLEFFADVVESIAHVLIIIPVTPPRLGPSQDGKTGTKQRTSATPTIAYAKSAGE